MWEKNAGSEIFYDEIKVKRTGVKTRNGIWKPRTGGWERLGEKRSSSRGGAYWTKRKGRSTKIRKGTPIWTLTPEDQHLATLC
jgi:hypothetical protein